MTCSYLALLQIFSPASPHGCGVLDEHRKLTDSTNDVLTANDTIGMNVPHRNLNCTYGDGGGDTVRYPSPMKDYSDINFSHDSRTEIGSTET